MATQTETTTTTTAHHLSHSQRTRLIRSTRKLGSLLGTTPQVIDEEPRTPRGSFDRKSKLGSAGKHGGQTPLPPPLVLRLQAVPRGSSSNSNPSSSSSPSITLQVPLSPLSPTLESLNRDSPQCPLPPSPSSISYPAPYDIRRKKMAKLTRTLGENIPPELVFQSSSPRPAKKFSRSWSVESLKTADLPLSLKAEPVELDFVVRVSSSSEESSTWKPQIQPRSSSLRVRSRTQSISRSRRDDRSCSPGSKSSSSWRRGHGYTPSESQTGFLSSSSSWEDDCWELEEDPNAYGRKKEREWSGEWNQKDMGDVLRKLRNLK
ncbi:hypothetical protein Moror_10146 [Moniliophthora roreri MCA 2997]|uniref:Uncharacterized protein n=1 Tax=Moniliophthora roreri (strain MCA 2997) TaxID=1381753 RepID=V2WC38_MONRO|nr:hypothetical protein Moror_10146 [Moniliophthora roreri MCA 2997]